ncbi:MAG TPA: hypothetical protein VFE13_07440 [Caulobacteraceae bacterium]|nr:hypothetical protein [Caulobacteraceae bacterium]
MPDTSFEFNLERMFAETPARPDADFFAARVLERLDRGWTARRVLIGSMGALGGLVGAYQILGATALQQLTAAAAHSNDLFTRQLTNDFNAAMAPSGFAVDGQALWMAAGVAVIIAGLGLARIVREI